MWRSYCLRRYVFSMSGALALMNIVPCYALDGQWAFKVSEAFLSFSQMHKRQKNNVFRFFSDMFFKFDRTSTLRTALWLEINLPKEVKKTNEPLNELHHMFFTIAISWVGYQP